MITRIEIDPNVRVRGNGTRAGFEDVSGPLAVNMKVEVYEPESELVGPARVTEIDTEKQLVYLSVDWARLECRSGAGAPVEERDVLAEVHALPPLTPSRPMSTPVWLSPPARGGLLTPNGHLRGAAGQKQEELVVTAL
ncbi:hypothetical protein ACIPSH_07585 [Streptomyces iakyrus]|uniref:hypothetical protein n=1 Tax=Streptomyces iakyrus TaxID=68219 RepID=UPI0038082480